MSLNSDRAFFESEFARFGGPSQGGGSVVINTNPPPEVMKVLEEREEEIAKLIETEAKGTTAFKDKTGKLRKSIKAKKKDGRWIVEAKAPHAHLVEYGHGGPNPAPAHPFLRPARERVVSRIK